MKCAENRVFGEVKGTYVVQRDLLSGKIDKIGFNDGVVESVEEESGDADVFEPIDGAVISVVVFGRFVLQYLSRECVVQFFKRFSLASLLEIDSGMIFPKVLGFDDHLLPLLDELSGVKFVLLHQVVATTATITSRHGDSRLERRVLLHLAEVTEEQVRTQRKANTIHRLFRASLANVFKHDGQISGIA